MLGEHFYYLATHFLEAACSTTLKRSRSKTKKFFSRLSQELRYNFTSQFNISINESDFQRFMKEAFEVVRIGNKADWSILVGLSFSMTTLSTVGKWLKVARGYLMVGKLVSGLRWPAVI